MKNPHHYSPEPNVMSSNVSWMSAVKEKRTNKQKPEKQHFFVVVCLFVCSVLFAVFGSENLWHKLVYIFRIEVTNYKNSQK